MRDYRGEKQQCARMTMNELLSINGLMDPKKPSHYFCVLVHRAIIEIK